MLLLSLRSSFCTAFGHQPREQKEYNYIFTYMHIDVYILNFTFPGDGCRPQTPRLVLGASAPQTPAAGGVPPPQTPARMNIKYRPNSNYPMICNNTSGQEIGLPGLISAGL